ncbi:MoaD/ThiS family protein [Zoogloea sp.]|uniref:MoaD/ThiS family protein n=1 Tax=Zoogloea sp. TaxID=49181 RepID=UPI00260121C4|nr:MoaD/ThiS family protein [Zoogloea sp.]MCK6394610.1 MoaD/ThiS family protein [Zoogloea sp.]
MRVLIPSALHSYTGGARAEADGETLAEVLADLDRHHPGIRFRMIDEQNRIRRHIRFFSENIQIRDLDHTLPAAGELIIVQALSGG